MTSSTAPGTAQQAERLWVTAHEHVRRGDFAAATRDLSQAFAILQALKDPRVAEVHKRWTEVHKLYVEDGARAAAPAQQKAAPAPNLEAEAEAAANAGNLESAIQLYEKALAKQPQNELVAERLVELRAARPRAAELTEKPKETPAAKPAVVVDEAVKRDVAIAAAAAEVAPFSGEQAAAGEAAAVDAAAGEDPLLAEIASAAAAVSTAPAVTVASTVAPNVGAGEALELEAGPDLDLDIHDRKTVVPQPATDPAPREAPPMAADDAPIGMGSLDVAIDMGEAVSHFVADELPVGTPTAAETPAPSAPISATDPMWSQSSSSPSAPVSATDPMWSQGSSSGPISATDPMWDSPSSNAAASSKPAVDVGPRVALLEELLMRIHKNRRAA